ncbi:hypothetical protein M3Y99_00374400 [Aphelenchoides fujianensis]|nr:hypothetical protein M3Y99_00374400 [Aphelenchoides fujianensis]
MSDDEETPKMTIKFKTTQTTHELEVAQNATVEKVKDALAAKLNHPKERLTLIFSGKILKDPDSIASYGIKDGMVVHMVQRAGSSTAGGSSAPAAAPPAGGLGGLLGSLGGMAPNISPQAQQLMSNPEFMRTMMDSPMMQSMLNSPELLRSLFSENPAVQQIIQRNPELGHVLNDPETIRQTLEMVRNPSAFQEMMRNHDQAVRNLQGIPGGEAALQRLYTDVQEPLLNSTMGSLSGNPFQSNPQNNQDSTTVRELRTQKRCRTRGVRAADRTADSSERPPARTRPPRRPATLGALGSMISPEMVSGVMRQLANRPELLNALGPAGSQMGRMLQNINPATLTNPRVMNAMRQIQQATEVLRQEAPELANMMGIPSGAFGGLLPGADGGAAAQPAENPAGGNQAGLGQGVMDFASLLQGMNLGGMGGGQAAPTQPPEERFRSQLEQLVGHGLRGSRKPTFGP